MLVGWFVRLLVVALLAFAVRLLLTAIRGVPARSAHPPQSGPRNRRRPAASVPLVKDPVCGTYVEPTHAVSTHVGAEVHYFCSESCRRAFRQTA